MKKLNLDVLFDCKEHDIDMQYGLEALKGTSDVISIVSETILRKKVPDKRTHKSDVRTRLKESFKGSYGHKFSLQIEDPSLKRRLKTIGDETFLEIVSYFISEALFLEHPKLSKNAEDVVESLDDVSDKLIERLNDPLIEMHKISRYFKHDLKLRYRKRGEKPKQLALLNQHTSANLCDAEKSSQEIELEVVIVRFHSITGNGRFYIRELDDIESFGFESKMRSTNSAMRMVIANNLTTNTNTLPQNGTPIKVRVKKLTLPTGKVVKYLITGID